VSGIIALALQARWEYNDFDHPVLDFRGLTIAYISWTYSFISVQVQS
jgi:hypothetical protein